MFCTHCGTKRQPGGRFCTGCGSPVPAAAGTVASAPPAAPRATTEAPTIVSEASGPAPAPPYATPAASWPPVPAVHPSVAAVPPAGAHAAAARSASDEPDAAKTRKIVVTAGAVVTAVIVFSLFLRFLSRPSFGGFVGILFLGLLITLAVVGFVAYRAHAQETKEARTLASLPPSVQHVVAQMEPGAQAAFFNEYERYKKRIVVSYLLLWAFGAHYFYLRQPLLNVAYWFTFAGGGFWYWFDVVRMPSLVREANEQTARQALQTLHIGAVFAQMPSAPAHMVQPVPPASTVHPAPGPQLQDR